jgi:hypothetical protein
VPAQLTIDVEIRKATLLAEVHPPPGFAGAYVERFRSVVEGAIRGAFPNASRVSVRLVEGGSPEGLPIGNVSIDGVKVLRAVMIAEEIYGLSRRAADLAGVAIELERLGAEDANNLSSPA